MIRQKVSLKIFLVSISNCLEIVQIVNMDGGSCNICWQGGNGDNLDESEILFPQLKLYCSDCEKYKKKNNIHAECFAKYYWIQQGKTLTIIIKICCPDATFITERNQPLCQKCHNRVNELDWIDQCHSFESWLAVKSIDIGSSHPDHEKFSKDYKEFLAIIWYVV